MSGGPTKSESGFDFWLRAGEELDADAWFAGSGLKSVDFLVGRADGALWFVEAKSSSPRAPERLSDWLGELCEKVARTAAVLLSLSAGRALTANLGASEPWVLDCASSRWEVVLVIPNHDRDWLPNLRDALRAALRPLARSFGIDLEPRVLNRDLAQRLGLGP